MIGDIIDYLNTDDAIHQLETYRSWYSVGPGLLTRMLDTNRYSNMITIFPSYMFLPWHFTGECYRGYKKVYAYQEWSDTKNNYGEVINIPEEFGPNVMQVLESRERMISILVSSYSISI